jgi:hypothetical protein
MSNSIQISRRIAVAKLYPDLQPRDIGIYGVTFHHVPTGQRIPASAWIPHHRADLRDVLNTLLTAPEYEVEEEWVIEIAPSLEDVM